MGFRSFIGNAFSSGLKTVTDVGAKAITGPVKDISGTAKDVTGIRKDLVETKLAEYKVEEHFSLIQKAGLEDVKTYDPKTRNVIRKAMEHNLDHILRWPLFTVGSASLLFLILRVLGIDLSKWISRLLW